MRDRQRGPAADDLADRERDPEQGDERERAGRRRENASQARQPVVAAAHRVPVEEGRERAAARPPTPATTSPVADAPHAACAFAASSVLRSSIAIVIGPTPPGTGVIRRGALGGRREGDVADQAGVGAVDADVDHRGALLDPVALDELGPPDRGDEHVGAAADRREVARARVAGGDGGVGGQQQRRDRLADEVRAADDDGLGALERDVVAAQQLHHAGRRARAQAGAALGQQPGGDRREAVDVLGRVDQLGQRGAVDLRRRRQLEQDARDRRVVVEALQQPLDLVVRARRAASRWSKPSMPTSAEAFCLPPT